jgi:hypothetical protein
MDMEMEKRMFLREPWLLAKKAFLPSRPRGKSAFVHRLEWQCILASLFILKIYDGKLVGRSGSGLLRNARQALVPTNIATINLTGRNIY